MPFAFWDFVMPHTISRRLRHIVEKVGGLHNQFSVRHLPMLRARRSAATIRSLAGYPPAPE
jgi:hypothetical protein